MAPARQAASWQLGATWFRRDDEDHWLHVVFSRDHLKKLDAYYKRRI
jgi:hypothetical protein